MSKTKPIQQTLPLHHDPTIRGLEVVISKLLRAGVIISVALIAVGAIAMFAQHPEYLSSSTHPGRILAQDAKLPHSLRALLVRLYELRGDAINMTNTPTFGAPTSTLSSTIYGRIRDTVISGSRKIQLGAKILF